MNEDGIRGRSLVRKNRKDGWEGKGSEDRSGGEEKRTEEKRRKRDRSEEDCKGRWMREEEEGKGRRGLGKDCKEEGREGEERRRSIV